MPEFATGEIGGREPVPPQPSTSKAPVPECCRSGDSLPHDVFGAFVFSESNKTAVSQVTVGRPFDDLKLAYEDRTHPMAISHFRRGEPRTPSPRHRLWQIREMGTR